MDAEEQRQQQERREREQQEQRQRQQQNAGNGRMTRAQALEILDLKEGATKGDMRSAYRRLMQNVHPDRGGSNFFAKQLNEAREVLEF